MTDGGRGKGAGLLDREWVMANSETRAGLDDDPDNAGYVLPWDEIPAGVRREEIHRLRLLPPAETGRTTFPACISELEQLDKLQLGPTADPEMVRGINNGSIPASVRVLKIYTGGKPCAWPSDIKLPNVAELRTDFVLRFAQGNFPGLTVLTTRIDAKAGMLKRIAEYSHLEELELFPVSASDVFDTVGALSPARLGVLGGKLTSLAGIEQVPGLRTLRLVTLHQLRRIAAVRVLKQLEVLQVMYCHHIEDIEAILELPRLRRVEFVSCGNIGVKAIEPELRARSLEKLMISATT